MNDVDKQDQICLNSNCFHLNNGVESKLDISLLNIIVEKLELVLGNLENLERRINYMVYCIFALKEELALNRKRIEKINSDVQRIKTLEDILTILLSQ